MKRRQKGFTLVEIAIVLVIIGLLLGGILKGQEMIVQAKIKNAITDFSGISAAYHGYVDRYRAIPGDDPNAGTRWTGAVAGTGNGSVAGKYNSTTDTDESRKWWDHLRRSGFVAGAGYAQPFNALSGIIGVQAGDAAGAATLFDGLVTNPGLSGLIVCTANLPDKVSIAVDTQMDDGFAGKGTVRAKIQTAPNPDVGVGLIADATYAETGTNVYTVCRAM